MTKPSRCSTISTPGRCAHDAARFAQDHLDQARILVDLRPPSAMGARRRADGREIDLAAFRLGDDLLRDDQNIACGDAMPGLLDRTDTSKAARDPRAGPGEIPQCDQAGGPVGHGSYRAFQNCRRSAEQLATDFPLLSINSASIMESFTVRRVQGDRNAKSAEDDRHYQQEQ